MNYLKCLFTAINEQVDVQREIKINLNTPIGPNNIQKIKLCSPPMLHFLNHHLTDFNEDLEVFEYRPVLGIQLYIQMEDIMKQSLYLDENLSPVEIERRHILHKLVYDCLNEALDYRRLWGLDGRPFAFKASY